MVLGSGADQRRAADVDSLDAAVEIGAVANRCLEGIEIDHEQIDRRDRVLFERALVRCVAPHGEQPAMDARMQRLDPPIQHLGHAGNLGYVGDL